MIRTPCGYHHSILMGNRPPSNLTGRTCMPTWHHRPHEPPSPCHRPWARAAQGRRATRIGTGDTRIRAWQHHACLAPCGLCCAARGHTRRPASYTAKPRAGGWCLGCWPHRGRPAHLTRFAASATAGARPAQAPHALRPVADVRMPVHATIDH